MPGLRETLEAATPVRGIGTDDEERRYEEADARLRALAPELAALVLDMGDFLREIEDVLERDEASDWFERDFHSLLARLDQLGKEHE